MKKMTRTCRLTLWCLDLIFCWFSNRTTHQLWDILCGLRGPDNMDVYLKGFTTVPVRCAAFPRLARRQRSFAPSKVQASFNPRGKFNAHFCTDEKESHFIHHVRKAAEHLAIYSGD